MKNGCLGRRNGKTERREQNEKWVSWEKRWEAERREQNKKWEENQRVINEMLASIQKLDQKHEATIGALGARWGLHSE